MVFYPEKGISQLQERLMTSSNAEQARVVAVRGNFDDCQTNIKSLFGDLDLARTLSGLQVSLEINLCTLLPTIK